ncbi:MAG: hypothetical protein L6R43_20645, partial [Planctomycetes bacterium]|nr:hypothetical protein [Planctomycetota bacterium]
DHAIVAIEEKIIGGEGGFVLAYGLPDRIWALDRIAFKLDAEVEALPGDAEEIRRLLDRAFHAEAKEVTEVADELAAQAPAGNEIALSEDVLVLDDKAPAVKLVHAISSRPKGTCGYVFVSTACSTSAPGCAPRSARASPAASRSWGRWTSPSADCPRTAA